MLYFCSGWGGVGKKETKTMTRSAKENGQTLRPTSKACALEEVGETIPQKVALCMSFSGQGYQLKRNTFRTNSDWEKQ